MNEYTIKLARPHCSDCGKVRVKDANGENRYVKKVTNRILSEMAEKTSEDLRSRLENVTTLSSEDDI